MNESGEEAGAVPVEGSAKIPPVETADVSPVEEPEMVVAPTEPERLVPADLISVGAQQAACEAADRLEELLKGKFEPIDCLRSARVELEGACAIIEVRVMLRGL